MGGQKTFAVGHQTGSKTQHISVSADNYLGTGKCITIIDTPGASDSGGNKNQSHDSWLVNEIQLFILFSVPCLFSPIV